MIEYFNTYNKSEFTKLFSLLVVLVFSAQALSQDYKNILTLSPKLLMVILSGPSQMMV